MRERLLALLKTKNERKAEIVKLAEKADKVEDLRSLNKELDEVNEEIRNLQEMVDELPEEDERTAAVTGAIPGVVQASAQEQRKSVDEEEMEYRKAFQQFVTKGTAIPAELRDDAITATTDLTTAIPSVLVNQIIEKLESTGMILPLVTKTSFPAGMSIPTSSVKPVASWVAEGAGSDKQKKEVKTAITFTHFKLRCEIAMTQEASVMAISAFEAALLDR